METSKLFRACQTGVGGAKWETAIIAMIEAISTAPEAEINVRRCEGELRMPSNVMGHRVVALGRLA